MSIPQTSGSFANLLRLTGLKKVPGRNRVLPGAEFLQQLEAVNDDVSGTSDTKAPIAPNLPELERGAELSPQSYDVRANQVISPEDSPPPVENEQPAQESIWTKFGRALAMQAGHAPRQNTTPPPVETQQVDVAEGLPPVNPEAQAKESPQSANSYLWKSLGSSLKEYAEPFMSSEKGKEALESNKALIKNAQMKAQGLNPEEEIANQNQIESDTQLALHQDTDQVQQNPQRSQVYGAGDEIAKRPDLQKTFKEITGEDFTPQIKEMTQQYEQVMNDVEKGLNAEGAGYTEQAKRIKERIDANAATDMDKYYIGLALLMPLLVAGLFGKEAALGALGGGAKGIADVYSKRMKDTREDEELLADINKNQGILDIKRNELKLEKLKIPEQIKKNLPKDERAFLHNKKEWTWVDPVTAEKRSGVEIKPGLVALPEYLTSKEDLKEMGKQAEDIAAAKTATQLIDSLTDDIMDISSQLKDRNIVSQGFQAYMLGKRPDLASKLSETVDFEGRKVNAAIALEHKLKLLTDAYRQAKSMRALTQTVQEHIDGLFRNPAASFQSYQDSVDQMLYTRSLAQKNLIQNAANQGFAPEILEEEFGKKNRKSYDKLNKKEEEKISSELLRE